MRLIPFVFVLAALLLVSCNKKKKEAANAKPAAGAKAPPMKVDGYIIRTESFQENIEVPGTIVANEVAEIHPEVSGRIVQLNVAEGKYVGKGTLLQSKSASNGEENDNIPNRMSVLPPMSNPVI